MLDATTHAPIAGALIYAAWTLEENTPDATLAVSIAKMYASDASRTVGNRGIQIHGGMGFTWEVDVHLFLKRAWVLDTHFDTAERHAEVLAAMVAS